MTRSAVATDDFNRAALGANWAQVNSFAGVIQTLDDLYVEGSHASNPAARWSADTFDDDQYSSLELVTYSLFSNNEMGVIARASTDDSSGRDFYAFMMDDTSGNDTKQVYLVKRVDGASTDLASGTFAFAAGDRIEIECEGTSIRGMVNGVEVLSVTDGDLTGGYPGVTIEAGLSGNNWEGGNIVAGDPPADVSITDAGDEVFFAGESVSITGGNFGAAQGTGRVVISPADDIDDAGAVEQTVTSWADGSIDVDIVRGALTFDTAMYMFVENDAAASNASGYAVQFEPLVTVTETLEDENGSVVASVEDIKASIWRNREPTGAPDEELTGLATSAAGELEMDIARGALSPGDSVYLMLHKDDAVDWAATIVKLVPTYS